MPYGVPKPQEVKGIHRNLSTRAQFKISLSRGVMVMLITESHLLWDCVSEPYSSDDHYIEYGYAI